jgi:hypothetical protein
MEHSRKRAVSSPGKCLDNATKKSKVSSHSAIFDFFYFIAPLPTEAFLRKLSPKSLLCLRETSASGQRLVKREVETRLTFRFTPKVSEYTSLFPENIRVKLSKTLLRFGSVLPEDMKGTCKKHTHVQGGHRVFFF